METRQLGTRSLNGAAMVTLFLISTFLGTCFAGAPVGPPEPVMSPGDLARARGAAASLDLLLLRDAGALVSEPDAWCPTSKEFARYLVREEERYQARSRAAALAAGPMTRRGESGPSGGAAPALPVARYDNGVVVMEDDGTLLADDRTADIEGTSLEMTPAGAGFNGRTIPLAYETDLGAQIATDNRDFAVYPVTLTRFSFPFAGAPRTDLFLTTNIGIFFSTPAAPTVNQLKTTDVIFDTTPRIGPFLQGTSRYGWNIFFREEADRAVVTWRSAADGTGLDIQAVLFADGSIHFNYQKLGGVQWGAMVVNPDTTGMLGDTIDAAVIPDPVDVALGFPEDTALDVTRIVVRQVRDTEILSFQMSLLAPPPDPSRYMYYQVDLLDEPADAGAMWTLVFAVENGAVLWSTEPTLKVNGTEVTWSVLASRVGLKDGDFSLRHYSWVYEGGWHFAEWVGADEIALPTPAPVMMVDVTGEFPVAGRLPLYECFTLPELRPHAVYDAFRKHFGDPKIDGLAIYQNFYTDIIFYAGAYSTVGNAGADGIGNGASADPPSPALLHMNTLEYGWNSYTPGRAFVLNHEFGHHWLYFISIMEGGVPTTNLNPRGGHPAGWVHAPAATSVVVPTDCSCMGGTTWTDNGNGTFTSPPFSSYGFSWHELYLMGLADPGEVTDWWYITNPNPGLPDAYWPPENTTVSGTRTDVNLQQVIDALGARVPDAAGSPHALNVPFVLVTRPGRWSSAESAILAGYCALWAPHFNATTIGRGTISCNTVYNQAPDGVIDMPAGDVSVKVGSSVDFTSTGTDVDGNTPLTFAWDFGGGAPASAVEDPGPMTFSTLGDYTVTLTATDALGLADQVPDTRAVHVMVCVPPAAPVGDTLYMYRASPTEIQSYFGNLVPAPDDYVLLRDTNETGPFDVIETSGADGVAGILFAMPPESLVYYRVAGRNLPDCIGPK